MSSTDTTAPNATRLIAQLRDTADAYTATSEAIPDRTIRILCDALANVHRLFATELQSLFLTPEPATPLLDQELFPTTADSHDALELLLDRSCQLEDQFRLTLRADLPNDVDLFVYRLYSKVRRARERLLSVLLAKPYLTGLAPVGPLAISRCA
jgi:hypothetical protein